MLKLILCTMAPGLASSALKRFTSLNIQAIIIGRISNNDAKYWAEKYFSANDYVIDKSVTTVNGLFSDKSEKIENNKKD